MMFKKMIPVLMSAAMLMTGMTAYAEETTEEETTEMISVGTQSLAGGWNLAEDQEITEEIRGLVEQASQKLMGADYEPVAYLGYQVVAGRNHCVLCRTSMVTSPEAGSQPYYTLLYIYEALDGSVEIKNVAEIDIAAYAVSDVFEEAAEAETSDEEAEAETSDEEAETEAFEEETDEIGEALMSGFGEGFAGGWSLSEETEITDEAAAVFEKAAQSLLGVNYTPIAELATQIVAGTNHCFLCEAEVVYPNAVPYYALVYVYEDLEGGAEVTNVAQLDIAELSQPEMEEEEPEMESSEEFPMTMDGGFAGGWSLAEETEVTEEAQELLAKATESLLGVNYEAVAYLGSQLVAGTNHCFLCRTTVVYPGAQASYALVYVYENLEGNAEVTNIVNLDIAELSQPAVEE